jgi:hypothetical protein
MHVKFEKINLSTYHPFLNRICTNNNPPIATFFISQWMILLSLLKKCLEQSHKTKTGFSSVLFPSYLSLLSSNPKSSQSNGPKPLATEAQRIWEQRISHRYGYVAGLSNFMDLKANDVNIEQVIWKDSV